ncbi:hypothetical protein [Haloferax sulfurifontis]|uniref:Lipoprotein n=2 Tax=Haloferax sulfurifontis TaxID=255616 RepID=M0I4P2_9EURY|nr:hypothetical protein [Haloferax sulfurifontis]ELZ90354.1 hypothetical protein C441_13790 [Haloferax sulfurifontis ATCC BAA-897]GGC51469.1 hypothetical protein GCM10007209_11360 [Haloferax sulfurifontis]
MQRRRVLASLGSLAFLSGCLGGPAESSSETETETATTTDECGWPQFCEGSEMVEVAVNGGFDGEVILKPACREGDVELSPGETVTLTRQVDAETCDVKLLVDGEAAYDERIQDYEYVTLRVGPNGEITRRKEEL